MVFGKGVCVSSRLFSSPIIIYAREDQNVNCFYIKCYKFTRLCAH